MAIELPLDTMTVEEKLQVLDAVWNSLLPEDVPTPDWLPKLLEERVRRLDSGEVVAVPWEEAKARLLQLGK